MTQPAVPPDLPALDASCRISVLFDVDALSHGAAEGTPQSRACDEVFAAYARRTLDAGLALASGDPTRLTFVYAASTASALHHLRLAAEAPANSWRFCRGLDGADHALNEELLQVAAHLQNARRPSRRAVVLVGQDHAYAPAVRRLRLLGCPTWVLQPGRYIAADLYKAACAVTPLIPHLAA